MKAPNPPIVMYPSSTIHWLHRGQLSRIYDLRITDRWTTDDMLRQYLEGFRELKMSHAVAMHAQVKMKT